MEHGVVPEVLGCTGEITLADLIATAAEHGAPDDLTLVRVYYAGCGTHDISIEWGERPAPAPYFDGVIDEPMEGF